jgi:Dullard-like phosphatase family protein
MFTTLAAVITTVAIASAIVLYALKKMVSHRLRAMTNRNHVAPFSAAASQEQDDVPDAAIPDDNSSPSVMQTCCPLLPLSREPWKPTLVLDLDETLVHAVPVPVKPMFPAELLKVSQDEGDFVLWLAIRPHVQEFLSSMAAHYELVVWTAGTEPYGRAVVQRLDPSGSFISHSLYRQHCTQRDGRFIKDLSRLGRDERTRICDNNPVSFSFQPSAGILVNDFVGDPQDVELVKLLRQLTPTDLDDVEMVDVEHVPFSARRVRFGLFVNVKMYDPEAAPYVEDVEMVDTEALRSSSPSLLPSPFILALRSRSSATSASSTRRFHFDFKHVKVYDPNEAPCDADSFGFEEPEEMVKETTALKMFNELGPVGVEDEAVESTVRYGCIALPCRTNTAFSSDFEAQEQAVPRAEESVEVPVTAPKRPVFEEQEVPQAEEPVEDEDTAPKRPRRPRVSNGGPLRRSARLARKYPRRSARLAAKRLAEKP